VLDPATENKVASVASATVEDAIAVCPHCGRQNFVCSTSDAVLTCWGCRRRFRSPTRLLISNKHLVVLNRETKLYAHHLTRRGDPAVPGPPYAEVAKHPTRDLVGLKNVGTAQWFIHVPGKSPQTVEPGRSVSLVPGTEITFGELSGVVQE
jgi:hypothetical protein